ncbi:ATP-binding cassette domain-containing protein [Frateuria hangzhouensis]|uniref:ATP-binding cassette domain-containing protein n=1 Tax=Frateuria hangzhouensis TaxID=2995589 RepID=UPI002260D293|nr:ATP-binding cassette domain-containing protein [Frateuria sp. STR12]MCX7514144.1 ATP-binding cassette domain-containing protein [Frateuria sp. STR12]
MSFAIETQSLCRRFGDRLVVDQISLHVPRRAIYGFLGRNGAGKTTTLKILLGLLRADHGRALVDGIDVAVERRAAARRVGALLEAHGFYVNLSGEANLDLTRRLLGCPATEVARVLALVELGAHARRRVADYSLGMRQRLGLARALLGAPPVLVLDEPTNGLDPEGMADMRRFLRELPERTGVTVLLSSHLLGEIEHVATHVGILSQGRLVMEGGLAELKAGLTAEIRVQADDPARAAKVARAHGFTIDAADDGLTVRLAPGEDPREGSAALNRALCAAGVAVHALHPELPSLERLYRAVSQSPAAVEATP